ncbi:uncharacterized protein K460DRAFT_360138 [Cucurbitaria berberidis CBS 394.84]|uniref:Uncharacterized protein n=1 Tax=Cucurbitaria berberidis CBS 394.84 TaxID=1168544 RepID=A0A9P4G7I0_9PLEO|nr:uncharacterized protein K460DRAFT_360138 [Cucurbitaria berberidis CBS 394.84]KAF1840465.1 hypothetical protein K460DRAFT_360138 [Cucurbitaria berberidis CBS 394.84]
METLDDGPFRKRTDSMQLLLPAKLSSQSSTRTTQPRVNSLAPVIGNAPTWRPIPDSQRDNLLLRLPAEIRNWIYKLVLGGRTYKFKDAFSTHYARLDTTEQHLFGLLFVCRQIYFEAALLPYAINTFRFRDFDISLSPFLKERSPAQFRSIQSLELVTYQAGQ